MKLSIHTWLHGDHVSARLDLEMNLEEDSQDLPERDGGNMEDGSWEEPPQD